MCTDVPDCNFSFSPGACATGVMPPSSAFDMASLHWPTVLAWPDKATQELLDHVHANQSVHSIPLVLDDEMMQCIVTQANKLEGGTQNVPAVQADIFAHSVGIVRDWLRYHSDEEGAADIQNALDEIWPHWDAQIDTYGAKPTKLIEADCTFPSLFQCGRDSDCGEALTCASRARHP
jgi:hypothetical protein